MKHIVGVADCGVSADPDDTLITHALGSCLGITAHDADAGVAGLLHVMMPLSEVNEEKAKLNPFMFVDTGMPRFIEQLEQAGARLRKMRIMVAGGASVHKSTGDRFAIGKRNMVVFKRIMWAKGLLIAAEDVGGSRARTMRLFVDTGRVIVSSGSEEWDLQPSDAGRDRGRTRDVA